MMKKTVSKAAVVALALCFFIIVFQISISSTSRSLKKYAITYSNQTHQVIPRNDLNWSTELEGAHEKLEMISTQNSHSEESLQLPVKNTTIICDRTHARYDQCSINGPTVLDSKTLTFFTMSSSAQPPAVENIQPYPRKFDGFIMPNIKNFTLTSGPGGPPCEVQHDVPALVFSAGGLIRRRNFYHIFDDGLIPLFITVNTIFRPDQDFVIVASEATTWWSRKFKELMRMFTRHPIIIPKSFTPTHCFPSATIGLISHDFMTINQTLLSTPKAFMDFRLLIDQAYTKTSRRKIFASDPTDPQPILVWANRKRARGRTVANLDQVVELMKKVGFDVRVFEPTRTPLNESYALLNASHAMIGVHGAALTHQFFLRPGSVFVQVVPIGLHWAADAFYGKVAKDLNLEYIEYRIGVNESSLVDKYGNEGLLLKDPYALMNKDKNGWPPDIMDIYLYEQDVKLDLTRFEGCLMDVYRKARRFMELNSNFVFG